jgi:hypothetical protein
MAGRPAIFAMSFARVYPCLVAKAMKKGRSQASAKGLARQLNKQVDCETFFGDAPAPNPSRRLITGVVCGIRVEAIQDPVMREIRYLDKLVDELARGKAMAKILRAEPGTRSDDAAAEGRTSI